MGDLVHWDLAVSCHNISELVCDVSYVHSRAALTGKDSGSRYHMWRLNIYLPMEMERHSLSPIIEMVLKCGAIYLSMLVMLLLATNVANSHAQFVGMEHMLLPSWRRCLMLATVQ